VFSGASAHAPKSGRAATSPLRRRGTSDPARCLLGGTETVPPHLQPRPKPKSLQQTPRPVPVTDTTSVKARSYQDKKKSGKISELQRQTLAGLHEFTETKNLNPTCQELAAWLDKNTEWFTRGVTQMQPRLTSELPEQGLVEADGERVCGITGQETTTWKLTATGQMVVMNL